jgi:N-acetylglucosaminyl-diphospho-decaprenol L-rhamnosyltransferase
VRQRNEGFSAGVNDAFAASSGSLVLLLNPDCVMDRGCVAALQEHLAAHVDLGGVAASLRGPDGGLQRFARREPSVGEMLWTQTETGRRLDQRFRDYRHSDRRRYEREWEAGLAGPLEVDCPAAACVLLRRELLEPRPLDPGLPLFFSDAELFRRSRAAGWRFEVLPAATAFHGYGTSHRRLDVSRRRAEWIASLWRYARAWRPWQRALLAAGLALDAGAAALMRALGRSRPDTEAYVRGTLGGLGLPGGVEPWLSAPAWRERDR